MKGDISRTTFDRADHVRTVRMQQGRVQLDADWNEQSAVNLHRTETEAQDVIGGCGGPIDAAGFRVVTDPLDLLPREHAIAQDPPKLSAIPLGKNDFYLTAGRYYVGGVLCENEFVCRFSTQPDPPARQPLQVKSPLHGIYLVYLDVWERHVTADEDADLREPALGGPDTATRGRVVWQARAAKVSELNVPITCQAAFAGLDLGGGVRPRLQARALPEAATTGACEIPLSAGYRGLGNQLFRVECHDPLPSGPIPIEVAVAAFLPDNPAQVRLAINPVWPNGTAVQLLAETDTDGFVAHVLSTVVTADGPVVTLSRNVTPITGVARLRPVGATVKWSVENGSVATAVESYTPAKRLLQVRSTGADDVRGFAVGNLVEVTCREWELADEPGFLVEVENVDSARGEIVLRAELATALPGGKGIVRRWEGIRAVRSSPAGGAWLPLQDGVQIQFDSEKLRRGDYWEIPARTATAEARSGDVLWPKTSDDKPEAVPPFGVNHRYCPLALVSLNDDGITLQSDCRNLFAPVTSPSLYYVGGDGQEALPDPLAPATLVGLPRRIVVGVAAGRVPVKGRRVRFKILGIPPTGILSDGSSTGTEVVDVSDVNGLASCTWRLSPTGPASPQVMARLLNAADVPVGLPVVFTASLSTADRHDGCELVVGAGERFQTIGEALKVAVAAGRFDVCLCLRRGIHKFSNEEVKPLADAVNAGVRLRLVGCGHGTRVVIDSIDRLSGWLAIAFERVVLQFDSTLQLEQFGDVSFDDCYLYRPAESTTAFLKVMGSRRLRVTDCLIEAWEKRVFKLPAGVFNGLSPAGLFPENMPGLPDRQHWLADVVAVKDRILKSTADEMKILVGELKDRTKAMAGAILTLTEQTLALLSEKPIRGDSLVANFLWYRSLFLRSFAAPAIAIEGADGDVRFENNDICGALMFYPESPPQPNDPPNQAALDVKQLESLSTIMGEASILPANGVVHLCRNTLGRVHISDAMRRALIKLSNDRLAVPGPLYQAMLLDNNVFESSGGEILGVRELLAVHVTMTANVFHVHTKNLRFPIAPVILGYAVAQRGAFTSNLGPGTHEFRLAVPAAGLVNPPGLNAAIKFLT